jgi:hypothetical protein
MLSLIQSKFPAIDLVPDFIQRAERTQAEINFFTRNLSSINKDVRVWVICVTVDGGYGWSVLEGRLFQPLPHHHFRFPGVNLVLETQNHAVMGARLSPLHFYLTRLNLAALFDSRTLPFQR